MTYSVTGKRPTHDIILVDADGNELGLVAVGAKGVHDPLGITRTPVERSSLKTSSGNQSYSDLEPPYTVLAQDEWSGGRGAKRYEDDVTRFTTSVRAETARQGKIILAGRETYGTGARNANSSLPGSMVMVAITGARERVAIRIAANANYTADKIFLWVAAFGTPSGNLTVRLCGDGTTKPSTVLQTKTITYADLKTTILSELFPFDHTNEALTLNAYYWIEVYADTGTATDYWKLGMSETAGTTRQSADDGTTWSDCTYDLYYRIADNTAQMDGEFFQYKKQLYFVTRPTDGTASKVWMNGYRGSAASNAGNLNKLIVNGTSPGWTTNEHVGKVVVVIEGNGIEEKKNWRVVTANDANSLTVDTNWLIQHDTTTSWLLLGDNKWFDVTTATITKTITDVLVTPTEMVIFAQGEDGPLVGMREANLAGTWTRTYTALGASIKAVFLEGFTLSGNNKLVRSNGNNTTVSMCAMPDWTGWATTNFGTQVQVGDKWDRITGLFRYPDSAGTEAVWVMKESGPWIYDGTNVVNTAREELKAIMGDHMGRVSTKSDVYLWMSVDGTIWRFYDPIFDDYGPMLDEGLESDMRGEVSAVVPYPGRTLISMDAGTTGYSGVYENNGGPSWHEKYRAPKGERIFDMEFQVVPSKLTRLWIRQGASFMWIPFPSSSFDPTQDTNFPYTHEGAVQLAPMYAGLQDAWKYWSELKLQLEDLVANDVWVEADYRLDDGAWVTMPDAFTDEPLSEQSFGTTDGQGRTFGVSSKKFELRVRMISTDVTKSPIIHAIIIEAVTVNQPKYTYSLTAKIERKDLNGVPDETLTPQAKQALLDTWSGQAQSLWMTCVNPLFSGRGVFLAPVPNRALTISEEEGEYTYTSVIALQEA